MGLFDLFKKKDSATTRERDLARLQKLTSSKLSQDLDRQDALERLAAMGTPDAARVLLMRFTWNLDPSIRDQEEKELAVEGIAKVGEAALPQLRAFCMKAESLTWPLKALRRVLTQEQVEEELLTLLAKFDTDYQRNPQPKIQLLQALEEVDSERARLAVEPFLTDSNEAVRFAAVTTLFRMASAHSLPALVAALAADESLRVKNRIAQGLVEHAWPLPDELHDLCRSSIPPGFGVQGSRVVGASRVA